MSDVGAGQAVEVDSGHLVRGNRATAGAWCCVKMGHALVQVFLEPSSKVKTTQSRSIYLEDAVQEFSEAPSERPGAGQAGPCPRRDWVPGLAEDGG